MGHRYVCADLHGRFDLYQEIKNFLKQDDMVYFLGDAIDRGPEPWRTAEAIYNDPQFFYIKGNHEDMLVQSLRKDVKMRTIEGYEQTQEECLMTWGSNGGYSTCIELRKTGRVDEWVQKFNNLPTGVSLINKDGFKICLTHAGFTPGYPYNEQDFIWSRHHFNEIWPIQHKYRNIIIVHGHTPIPVMKQFCYEARKTWVPNDGSFSYCNGHKLNIDLGAVWTGWTTLVDLDTWEELYFIGKDGQQYA